MNTITGNKVNIPKMKDCRRDIKEFASSRFSVLVDYTTDENLYLVSGIKTLKDLYTDFKFSALNELPIDNSLHFLPITKLDNLIYSY